MQQRYGLYSLCVALTFVAFRKLMPVPVVAVVRARPAAVIAAPPAQVNWLFCPVASVHVSGYIMQEVPEVRVLFVTRNNEKM